MITVAIDPAIRSPGVAVFHHTTLIGATNIRVPAALKSTKLSNGTRVHGVANLIWDYYQKATFGLDCTRVQVVYEWPQYYKGKTKDATALFKILAVGAAAAQLISTGPALTPEPREWAAQTKKATSGSAWASQRGSMISRRLTPGERELVPDQHDALDAVGLGLWAVGRFERIVVNAHR